MLIRIARLTTRFPRIVLAVAFALAVLFGIVGATASAHMKSGGFTTDDAESTRAAELLAENFPGASPNFVLLVSSEAGLRDPATSARATELVDALRARDDISGIQSFWTSPPPWPRRWAAPTATAA